MADGAGSAGGGGGDGDAPPTGLPSERAIKARAKVKAGQSVARKLKVKLGIVKRLMKEVESYGEEVERERGRLETMREEGKDEYDIKKQAEVLAESEMMIPDTKRRLDDAVHDLEEFIGSEGDAPEIRASEDLAEARRLIEEFVGDDGFGLGDEIGEDEM